MPLALTVYVLSLLVLTSVVASGVRSAWENIRVAALIIG